MSLNSAYLYTYSRLNNLHVSVCGHTQHNNLFKANRRQFCFMNKFAMEVSVGVYFVVRWSFSIKN